MIDLVVLDNVVHVCVLQVGVCLLCLLNECVGLIGDFLQGVEWGALITVGSRGRTTSVHSQSHLQVFPSGRSLTAHLESVEGSGSFVVLFEEVSKGVVGSDKSGEFEVGVEEHGVFDNRVSGDGLPCGEAGNSKHGGSSMADFDLSESLAGVGVITDRRVEVQGVKVVVTRDSVFAIDAIGHIGSVHLSELGVVVSAKGGLVFEKAGGSEEGNNSEEGRNVESVEDAGGASVLEHPRRCNQFGHGPSDDGKHSKSCVTKFGLLHGEQIKILGESKRIKTEVSGLGSVELWRSLQERNGGREFLFGGSATVYKSNRISVDLLFD